MANKPKLTAEEQEVVRRMHSDAGISYTTLAKQFNVSRNTILRICEPEKYAQHKSFAREYQRKNKTALNNKNLPNLRRFTFILSKEKDADLIVFFESQPNKNQYLKDLIEKDMKSSKDISADKE